VVYVEQAQRRIPVQYAKRMIGRALYGGTSTYIPLKVNQAGIIPVIFASSLLYLPQLLSNVWTSNATFTRFINTYLGGPEQPGLPGGVLRADRLLHLLLRGHHVQPGEVSDNMKKYGGFVPGHPPGPGDREYLDFILSRITAFGAVYLGLVAVLPYLLFGLTGNGQTVPFGGTGHPDHRRRRPRDGEAGGEPAHAAQLRRLPALVRAEAGGAASAPRPRGPPGAARAPRPSTSPSTCGPADQHRATSSARTSARGTPLGLQAKAFMDRGDLVPTTSPSTWSATGCASRTP
jgi:hypothetical protein